MSLSEETRIALEVQQKAYRDLIEVVRSTHNDRLKQPEANFTVLTVSLQFTQKEMDDLKKTSEEKDGEISKLKKELAELKNMRYKEEMEVIKKKLNYQEETIFTSMDFKRILMKTGKLHRIRYSV